MNQKTYDYVVRWWDSDGALSAVYCHSYMEAVGHFYNICNKLTTTAVAIFDYGTLEILKSASFDGFNPWEYYE